MPTKYYINFFNQNTQYQNNIGFIILINVFQSASPFTYIATQISCFEFVSIFCCMRPFRKFLYHIADCFGVLFWVLKST